MSTYYQLGCDDCKKCTGVISRNKDMQAPKEVYEFMFEHEGHGLIFYSEYNDERYTEYSSQFKSDKEKAVETARRETAEEYEKVIATIKKKHYEDEEEVDSFSQLGSNEVIDSFSQLGSNEVIEDLDEALEELRKKWTGEKKND